MKGAWRKRYMRIEIEDVRNYERALAYIARLGFTDVII